MFLLKFNRQFNWLKAQIGTHQKGRYSSNTMSSKSITYVNAVAVHYMHPECTHCN